MWTLSCSNRNRTRTLSCKRDGVWLAGLQIKQGEAASAAKCRGAVLFGLLSILVFTPMLSKLVLAVPLTPVEFSYGMAVFCCMPTSLSANIALTQVRSPTCQHVCPACDSFAALPLNSSTFSFRSMHNLSICIHWYGNIRGYLQDPQFLTPIVRKLTKTFPMVFASNWIFIQPLISVPKQNIFSIYVSYRLICLCLTFF